MGLNTFGAFHFLHPLWLLALVPLWVLLAWLALRGARNSGWSQVIDADLLPALRLERAQRSTTPWWIVGGVWTLAAVALAGPAWQREQSPAFRAPRDWLVLLDLSESMAVRDATPDRVTRARYVVDDILSTAQDARVALIVFAGDAHAVTPLTSDVETVRALLKPLAPGIMPAAGDLLAPALDEAKRLIESVTSRDSHIVVLTDGFADPSRALQSAAELRAQGVSIDVVGIGTTKGAPLSDNEGAFARDDQGRPMVAKLPVELLQRLAAAGGGGYTDLSGEAGLITALRQRDSASIATQKVANVELETWRNEGIWLLPPLLLMAALIARRGWL